MKDRRTAVLRTEGLPSANRTPVGKKKASLSRQGEMGRGKEGILRRPLGGGRSLEYGIGKSEPSSGGRMGGRWLLSLIKGERIREKKEKPVTRLL